MDIVSLFILLLGVGVDGRTVKQVAATSEVSLMLSEHSVGSEIMYMHVAEGFSNHGERVRCVL